MTIPAVPRSEILGDRESRVLLAVLAGDRTHDAVVERTGFSKTSVHYWLVELKRRGLVADAPGTAGTLHARVTVAA